MSAAPFDWEPEPIVLNWLAGGQLGNRLKRAVRLWFLLRGLYGSATRSPFELPTPFGYPDLRHCLYVPDHPSSDQLKASDILAHCRDSRCLCGRSSRELLRDGTTRWQEAAWLEAMEALAGRSQADLAAALDDRPFAVVHRSIRDDLKFLVRSGWLDPASKDRPNNHYQWRSRSRWPQPPVERGIDLNFDRLDQQQTWEVLRALESIAFVQPHLQIVVQQLWERATGDRGDRLRSQPPQQRIFIHLDYVLSAENQDRVDDYQEDIEQLWQAGGGILQFEYWRARENRNETTVVYPVCLHYARRAKYLTTYGIQADGTLGWHNHRLDRIVSPQLRVLVWGDPTVPAALRELRDSGQLPTPDIVRDALDEAWGFNFYLPKALAIVRFPRWFARGYVDRTDRHPTFKPVAYGELSALIHTWIEDPEERAKLLAILDRKPACDTYYWGWVRLGDINVTMRLRDWRPMGETIAPLALRQQMYDEAKQELHHYEVEPEVERCVD